MLFYYFLSVVKDSLFMTLILLFRDPKYYGLNRRPNWRRAVEVMERWSSKVPDGSESLYTIVMDVCEGAEQHTEVISTFKKMIGRKIIGSKSAFSFVIRACTHLKNSALALEIIEDYNRMGMAAAYMYEDVVLLLDSLGLAEDAMEILALAVCDGNLHRPISQRISKKVISRGLEVLARKGQFVSNKWINGTQIKSSEIFSNSKTLASNVFTVLRNGVVDHNISLTKSAYGLATKFLLGLGEYNLIRSMLNDTIDPTRGENASKIYDFALDHISVDTIDGDGGVEFYLLLIKDIVDSGHLESAGHFSANLLSRMYGSVQGKKIRAEDNSNYTKSLHTQMCMKMLEVFRRSRYLVGREYFPVKAYRIASTACEDARLEDLMLGTCLSNLMI